MSKKHSLRACSLSPMPEPGYRPCVGIFLLDRQDRVFVGRRHDMQHEAWQMPQGGIDKGEDPVTAGLREMGEEIGTSKATLLQESSFWRSYDLPPDLAKRMWHGRYRGQTQKWLAFRFDGEDGEIDLDHHDEPEFVEWRWIDAEELVGLIVPFKRDVYRSVVDEFRPLWGNARTA